MPGISSLTEKIDDEVYSKLRKANITTFVELGENKVFGLIGGGYAIDGSSTEAVRTSDYWHNYIKRIELFIRQECQSLKKRMLPFDPRSLEKILEIALLTINKEDMILLEKQRKVIIKIDYNKGNTRMCHLSDLVTIA